MRRVCVCLGVSCLLLDLKHDWLSAVQSCHLDTPSWWPGSTPALISRRCAAKIHICAPEPLDNSKGGNNGNAKPRLKRERLQQRREDGRFCPLTPSGTKTRAEANSMFQLLFSSWTNNSLCQQLVGLHGIYFSASERN